MPRDCTDWRYLRNLAESIAPRGIDGDHGVAVIRHERAETHVSGAVLDLVDRMLVDEPCTEARWEMTGGGCSAWVIGIDPDVESYVLITGVEENEASGDLSTGAAIGFYPDSEGGCPDDDYVEVMTSEPLVIAREVAAMVRRSLAK